VLFWKDDLREKEWIDLDEFEDEVYVLHFKRFRVTMN